MIAERILKLLIKIMKLCFIQIQILLQIFYQLINQLSKIAQALLNEVIIKYIIIGYDLNSLCESSNQYYKLKLKYLIIVKEKKKIKDNEEKFDPSQNNIINKTENISVSQKLKEKLKISSNTLEKDKT